MALQVRVAPSKVVLQNLLICVILFYTVYYLVLSVGCMALQVYELSVLAPFDFKTCPSWLNTSYQVLLISTEVTYFICGLLFVLIVEEWVWDYAISVTILHVAITSTVMLEFPLASHWWAALGSGLISMICGGQALACCLFKDNFIYPELDGF
ncbi:transmembrane protein 244 isoform X1 [Phyllostomus discolor]|uniref:Transmembrane protein 244 isoform X1 n=1 Tax=Phyllostomus discolor TaxID=89673 RepID=A0A7E6DNL6_9CHIR|nr:transmembrane protein 244 isoform X1 [Phyllostomus discolor]